MAFVIRLIDDSPGVDTESGYWTGDTYTHQGAVFAIRENRITNNTKKYTSRKRAENAAEKIQRKVVSVDRWEVEEAEGGTE